MIDVDLEIKLTAYAIGELDAQEIAAIEKRIAEDPECAQLVEEMRAMSAHLAAELELEPAPKIDRAMFRADLPPPPAALAHKPRRALRIALTVAAIAAGMAFLSLPLTTMRYQDDGAIREQGAEETTRSKGQTDYYHVDLPVPREHEPEFEPESEPGSEPGHESYASFEENPFLDANEHPLSTFSIDVDTASYSNLRRMILAGEKPPRDAVRIEEMINYFKYRLPPPDDGRPLALYVDVTDTPWNANHLLARVALKAKEIDRAHRADANLVFLIDVSGSMNEPNRLPLVKRSLQLLTESLGANDSVAIIVYAGASGVVLGPTSGDRRRDIDRALDRLQAGGSTDGGSGIQLAYTIARSAFKQGGINRVILATDGDFNVGIVDRAQLETLIANEAKSGVFLTVLGYGMGNYKDSSLETLADKGNGNYAYIDRLEEARKVLVEELMGTLMTVAKDVKLQIAFNPARIGSYRLLGYENRVMAAKDFNDDTKDAGDVGAGHAVTALYELAPAQGAPAEAGEIFAVRLRYKEPEGSESRLIERSVHGSQGHFKDGATDLRFAAAVAAFGMILRDSPHRGDATLEKVSAWAGASLDLDQDGLRSEFVSLVERMRR